MLKNVSKILFVVWALLLLPSLCVGGFIGHNCDCGMDAVCQHETGCDDDPCSQVTVSAGQRSTGAEVAHLHAVIGGGPQASDAATDARRDTRTIFHPPDERFRLQLARCDLPLLI